MLGFVRLTLALFRAQPPSLGSAAASKTGTAQRLTVPPTMNAVTVSPLLNADALPLSLQRP